LIHSQLDDIKGIGPSTKQKILNHFGSVKRAKTATKEEWIELLGNSRGSMVYEHFQAQISL
jgi:excinuclease ABC subunit C